MGCGCRGCLVYESVLCTMYYSYRLPYNCTISSRTYHYKPPPGPSVRSSVCLLIEVWSAGLLGSAVEGTRWQGPGAEIPS